MDINSMTLMELQKVFKEENIPAFHAKQVYAWLARGAESFDEMTDISKKLRKELSQKFYFSVPYIEKKFISEYDDTVKYLFRLKDGLFVESVLMKYEHGYSVCISTQAGCRMNCSFCATGIGGFERNLTSGEILGQVLKAGRDSGKKISNIVLMGMGEPLDNLENVLKFLDLVSSPDGINIGMRHISVSTCGLVDKIEELIPRKPQFTLSISLHAPNNRLRSQIMPINKKWNVDALLKVCRAYIKATGRRISFEYALINGFNDSNDNALELAGKLKGMICHVNLIPVNAVEGTKYRKSDILRQKEFKSILERSSVTVTVRRTLGADIKASCGQLRGKAEKVI